MDPNTKRDTELGTIDTINMSNIKVAGIGGLGFVAVAVTVAIFIPTIRVSIAIGAVTGAVFAVVLILWRRKKGPLPTSGQHPGAHAMLGMEDEEPAPGERRDDQLMRRGRPVEVPSHPV